MPHTHIASMKVRAISMNHRVTRRVARRRRVTASQPSITTTLVKREVARRDLTTMKIRDINTRMDMKSTMDTKTRAARKVT